METTFTERDKKLLYILGFIVIFFIFGWIIIRPMIKTINKTEENITAATELKTENEAKVMGLTSAQTLLDKFEADLEASTEEYYGIMDSSEIDKLFTMYVLESGLRAKDLIITMPVESLDESPYKWSEAAARVKTVSEEDDEEEEILDAASALAYTKTPLEIYTDAHAGEKYTTAAGIYCAKVTIVMTGSQLRGQKLLDDILTRPSLRVTGYAWDELAPTVRALEDGTVTVTESNEKQLTIRLNLYMYDKTMAGIEKSREK
ncbi:MAG: hypothetical protein IJ600_00350 [Lachnospiraceae bacterium]|nr:hypothetical protein [Lachnospiraceae bacterium]